MRSRVADIRTVARTLLVLGLTLAGLSLLRCSTPPSGDQHVSAPVGASHATPSAPAEVTVVYQPAQICPRPEGCPQGREVTWVNPGTTLAVTGLHVQELPRSKVHWFRVEIDGHAGWISEMATDKAPRVMGGKVVRD